MTKREAESFTAPYKFGRMGEQLNTWGHSEWTATGSAEAYHHDVPANDDVQMEAAHDDQQLPHLPADDMHVEPAAAADDAHVHEPAEDADPALADDDADAVQEHDVQERHGWSKRWFQRADGSWHYKFYRLKRAAP